MAFQTQRNEGVEISEANAWRMVSNATTSRDTRPQQIIRHAYISTLKNIGFEEEKGKLREWMTVARVRPAWARKVKYKLDLPPGSFTNIRRY
jgi:V8-like Glu-specific endopeptidase